MNSIKSITPNFNSKLVENLFALERLRFRSLGGSTPPWVFYDLKEIIHLVESFASAKIEGNKTTLIQAATDKINKKNDEDALLEIRNIQEAIIFIEKHIADGGDITKTFIRDIHKITTKELIQNNGNIPGQFRNGEVSISKTDVRTAESFEIPSLIDELVRYINSKNDSKDSVIKIAIAHHRFTVIHPFFDGNGRTARLLTYAMLLKQGFIDGGEFGVLNPMSIFGADRFVYFEKLSRADTQTDDGIEEWCLFVAEGVKKEIEKIHMLLDKKNTVDSFIIPAIKACLADGLINKDEEEVLRIAIEKDIIQRSDISHIFGTTESAKTRASRLISSMTEKGLIMPNPNNSRKYVIRFSNNILLTYILRLMDKAGMLPISNSRM